jgi:hypothetical protein
MRAPEVGVIGAHAEYARQFLLVWGVVTTLLFAIPLCFFPLAWARTMRFTMPAHTDLAVYFGRCLGAFALVLEWMVFRAALTGIGLVFVFEVGLAFAVLMVLVHVYGAVKGIQPMTETLEIGLWALFVVLYVLFFPVAA